MERLEIDERILEGIVRDSQDEQENQELESGDHHLGGGMGK